MFLGRYGRPDGLEVYCRLVGANLVPKPFYYITSRRGFENPYFVRYVYKSGELLFEDAVFLDHLTIAATVVVLEVRVVLFYFVMIEGH